MHTAPVQQDYSSSFGARSMSWRAGANLRISLALVALVTLGALSTCGGPEKLARPLDAGALGLAGQGGSSPFGAAGTQGGAGTTGSAGTSVALDAGMDLGAGGTTGAAGTSAAAGTNGGAGTSGAAGTAGGAGTTGAAGTSGGAGTTGAAGTSGAAGTTGVDAGTDTVLPGCNCMLKVQYRCLQNGPNPTQAEYLVRVVNTGTTSIPLNSVTVRYWYTVDTTGTQSGNCNSATHPCTISFVTTPTKPGADHYAVISFSGGTLPAGGDTGDVSIQMRGMNTYVQNNDYSFMSTGANTVDHPKITGYVSGKLLWGAPP
jgi:hypothetical protein